MLSREDIADVKASAELDVLIHRIVTGLEASEEHGDIGDSDSRQTCSSRRREGSWGEPMFNGIPCVPAYSTSTPEAIAILDTFRDINGGGGMSSLRATAAGL